MLIDAHQRKEISVIVANRIGILAEMADLLADHGINIEAVAGYAIDQEEAKIMLVVDDALRAVDALRKRGYTSIKEREVLLLEVENKPGALKTVVKVLEQENINISQLYGTAGEKICPERIVLSTNDDTRALVSFKKAFKLKV